MTAGDKGIPTPEAIAEEHRRVHRLRLVVQMSLEVIAQGRLSYGEASEIMMATRRLALQMFPDKEEVYDLIYRPKFQRLMSELYRLQ